MTGEWAMIWRIGITVTAVIVMGSILLAYARTVKRYWLGEMNREKNREWRRNEQE